MRASADGVPRPTVMIIGGGDSTCEELYDFGGGAAAVRRGYNAFLWEGPVQVGPLLSIAGEGEGPSANGRARVLREADLFKNGTVSHSSGRRGGTLPNQ